MISAAELSGEQLYKQQCAKCHGAAGEGGTDEYSDPLIGDKSVVELTAVIDKTMPVDDPQKCVGEDAKRVAAYIYDAFYSPIAQARNRPARIDLSRLTVRQYHNTVLDLVGSFRPPGKWTGERGLRGEYYKSRRVGGREREIDRIDPTVQFDFGEAGPSEKFDANEFSIRWEGSVLAPETGDYEFIVRTEHAARLWLNGPQTPLIDAWVKSGSDTEFRQSIRLLGGRVYPLKLEFSKAKQGVDDSKKNPNKRPTPASITLLWKLPGRIDETIPERCLTPQKWPEAFVLQTPFPPDDRSIGYERGTTISKAWDQATTDAAIEVAGYVAARLRELSGANADDASAENKLKDFCRRFVERAFRRPLSDEQQRLHIDEQFASAPSREIAVKRVVLLALKSPRFLYREVGGDPADPYNVAARISFGLWDSLPDQPLLDAAKAGKLADRAQIASQAERMLPDLRTQAKLRDFFRQWLRIDQPVDLTKDPAEFADFTPEIAADLRTSLDLTVEEVIASERADFRQFLLADSIYLNGRLAKFYGADLPEDAPFQKVALDPEQRLGVLTHPYLLAGFAYTSTSSPIHRGVFISRSVLGRRLRPPPEAVTPLAPELHADLTTRERIALQTKSQICSTCHNMINPLGFTLENFDAVGRFRAEEKGRPIDASGSYLTRGGETARFAGPRELATFLAASDETHAALVQQLFHHVVKQPVLAYGPNRAEELKATFAKSQFNVRRLAVEIIATAALPPTP
ncbi:MAG: DUF1592 domain-containing protein [Pirellulaceae bacterium]|nr:DUF1592 domain-containing protein [Pirellulaceae bacterium]